MKKGIIFSDVDGTLLFQKSCGLEEISTSNGITKVKSQSREFLTETASTNNYKFYINTKTKQLAKELVKDYYFVLVTAARKSTTESRKNLLDFADFHILENGGIILDNNFLIDKEWDSSFSKDLLHKLKEDLERQGWTIDMKGRTTMIRLKNKNLEKISLPKGLKSTSSQDDLEIIPTNSGKENAIKYLAKKLGLKNTIGIGNDINDIEMLKATKRKYVLRSSNDKLIEIAKMQGWHISEELFMAGINEILKAIKNS